MTPSDPDEVAGHGEGPGETVIYTNESVILAASENRHGYWLRRFALASVLTTFALIVLGGIVRVTGSGLGCGGEWPLCDGSLIPPLTKEDIIEYSHRLMASAIVGPLILATFAIAVIRYRRVPSVWIPSAVSVVLLLAQGGLGGVTVLTELPGHVVAAHLTLAQTLWGCLILVAVAAYRVQASDMRRDQPGRSSDTTEGENGPSKAVQELEVSTEKKRFPTVAATAAAATFILLLSGAYVTATPGALAACPQWPLCDGSLWPYTHLEAVHMLHRVVAAAVGVLILITLHLAYRRGRQGLSQEGTVLMVLAASGSVIFLAQVLVGAAAIWTHFPVTLRALHIGLATAVWGIMLTVALLVREREGSQPATNRNRVIEHSPQAP